MNDLMTASFESLMEQASSTAANYMYAAKDQIDKQFGEGYAKQHPELVAAFMKVAASDFNTACTAKVFESTLGKIGWSIDNLADKLER